MSYLGIDVGTSGIKAIAFNEDFKQLSYFDTNSGYKWTNPEPGRYEIKTENIINAVRNAIIYCSQKCKSDLISSISLSTFGGGISAVDKELKPLLNVILTTDNRAEKQFDFWIKEFGKEKTYRITGTTSHSSLMLPKIMWIKEHLNSNIYKFVTIPEIIISSLGLKPEMDYATASTTMMFDIDKKNWSDEILDFAEIERKKLPKTIPSGNIIGEIPKNICQDLGLRQNCKLVAGGQDQQVCALGAGLINSGEAADSLGTVECITILFDNPVIKKDLLQNNFSNLMHVYNNKFASFAYNFSSGSLLEWFRENFFCDSVSFDEMFSKIPACPSNVFVLPHFWGSGTPYMDSQSKGVITGLSLNTNIYDILRGIIDSQNYEMRLNLDIWKRNDICFDSLKAYGKGSSSDILLQIKSDILKKEIKKINVKESGCFGAALLAAKAANFELNVEETIKKTVKVEKTFLPRNEFTNEYNEKFEIYKEIYPAVKNINKKI